MRWIELRAVLGSFNKRAIDRVLAQPFYKRCTLGI